MITWIRFDWKEQPTFQDISEALAPHGLTVKSFENGDEYEYAIVTPETTNSQIIDSIIDNFDDADKTREELHKELLTFIKELPAA
jgi:hypothetical protein